MASDLYVHDIIVFNRVKSGNTSVYVATNLSNCFFYKVSAVADSSVGDALASTGTCLIPAFSLSAKTYVPPTQWSAVGLDDILSRQLVTLACDDIIAKGRADERVLSAKNILSTYETITIRSISIDDFSSNKCYLIRGV